MHSIKHKGTKINCVMTHNNTDAAKHGHTAAAEAINIDLSDRWQHWVITRSFPLISNMHIACTQ